MIQFLSMSLVEGTVDMPLSDPLAFDGRPLAYSICISIVLAFAAFTSYITRAKNSKEEVPDQSLQYRSTKNYSRFQEFAEYAECVKKHSVKDLDPVWITFTDSNLEDRFVRMTSENTFSHLLVPMTCLCAYVLSELFFDANWHFVPSIHIWNHDAAIVLNVCAITVLVSCYLIYTYFAHINSASTIQVQIMNHDSTLVASVSWVVSLVLFFGTRHRVCTVFHASERTVFGSTYDVHHAANDEVSVAHTLAFTLIMFSIYVPMRFYYLLHLGVILAMLYPFTLCLHGTNSVPVGSNAHICAFYSIVAASLFGQRYIEKQRRGTFQALLHSVDARMDMELEEELEQHVVGTALERLLTNLRTVDRHLETSGRHSSWATTSRHALKESLDILSHTDGLFSLNVDTMFKNDEKIASLDDRVDFKRYLKIEFGQAGGRKMFDGVMSERKADTLLSTWNKRTDPRKSMRRDTARISKGVLKGLDMLSTNSSSNTLGTRKKDVIPSSCCEFSVDMSGIGSDWNYDTLGLSARTGNRSLIFVGEVTVVPLSEEVFSCVESKELMRLFVRRLWAHYLQNPYHNEAHGATVCHMAHCLFNLSGLKELSNPPELMGMLVAALGHDCGHFGRNNLFCENSGHSVAYMYNDIAVLESMHAAITIRLLATGCTDYMGLLNTLSLEQRRAFKSTVISLIIATDMKKHFETVSKFRSKIAGDDWCLKQPACRVSLGKMIMKASDVGQAAVSWDLHMEWSMRVLAEFFDQGDEELALELPISPLCDRRNYDLCSSQKFFTDVLCRPLFEEIRIVAPEEYRASIDALLLEMSTNTDSWREWTQKYPWNPSQHHWPPALWWPEWKLHTPTGRALLNVDQCNDEAMPYPFDHSLAQVAGVEAHLEAIARTHFDAESLALPRSPHSPLSCASRLSHPRFSLSQ